MKHALLAPSAAAKRIQCPGSRSLEALYPQAEDDPKAIEGTFAHTVNVAMVSGLRIPPGATEEMLDGAELWQDTVMAIVGNHHVEQYVNCSIINKDCSGTPDMWIWCPTNKTLHVLDYKFGHKHVEAYENWQLICYAVGIIDSHPEIVPFGTNWSDSPIRVNMTIVQPRAYHSDSQVRTWSVPLGQLTWYLSRLQANALESMLPNAETRTGPECANCSARRSCKTLQKSVYSVIDMVGDNVPFDLAPEQLGKELLKLQNAIEILRARESGLYDEVLGRIKSGSTVPGWMTQRGVGREKWKVPIQEIMDLGEMMGVTVSKPMTITPKQAIKAGLSADLVRQYSEVPMGEIKLVPFKQVKEFKHE